MNNVLLVGNGFDLAHGLVTKYEHFLYLMKNWDEFYDAFQKERKRSEKQDTQCIKTGNKFYEISIFDLVENPEKTIDKYIRNASKMNEVHIIKLGNIIKNNSWTKYYCCCEAEIDGWIDFEREICPVINLFEKIFQNDYVINEDIVFDGKGTGIDYSNFTSKDLEIAKQFDKYVYCNRYRLTVTQNYISRNYGVLKKKIIADLRKEFEEFVGAFEIYLHEFVYKNADIKTLEQIKNLDINSVISFNYTLTEKLYGITNQDVHHLHGKIREDLTHGKNNMIMGLSEASEQNMDFIYFVKYFQRIQKASGVKYKKILRRQTRDDNVVHSKYNLYIYGHSLDETDKDIITYVIGTKEELENNKMKPEHVIIFYYDDTDYEQKVINLINLYGRDVVELYLEKRLFELVQTIEDVC